MGFNSAFKGLIPDTSLTPDSNRKQVLRKTKKTMDNSQPRNIVTQSENVHSDDWSVLQRNIFGTTVRVIADVSCGQFGAVRPKFKLWTYIQETVGSK